MFLGQRARIKQGMTIEGRVFPQIPPDTVKVPPSGLNFDEADLR